MQHIYTLKIVSPPDAEDETVQREFANLPGRLQSIEEDLTDLLPEGWVAQIRRFPWTEEHQT